MTISELGQELIRIGTAMRMGVQNPKLPAPGSPISLMLFAAVEHMNEPPSDRRLTTILNCEVQHFPNSTANMVIAINYPSKP